MPCEAHRLALLCALTGLTALTATAGDSPAVIVPYEAAYRVTWKGLAAGTSRFKLERVGADRFEYSSENLASGVFRLAVPDAVTQSSRFTLDGDRIVPQSFRADDGSNDKSRDIALDFDWPDARVTGVAEQVPVGLAITPGVLDPMTVQFAQMRLVAAGAREGRFEVVDKDRIKRYVMTCSENPERIPGVLGTQDTITCITGREGSSRSIRIWFASALGYVPVRAERLKGDRVEFTLEISELRREAG